MDFQIFKNRYEIKGKLEVMTALHIGHGKEEDGDDSPFMKDKEGNFYIPGSTMRGYLRTKLERYLNEQNGINLMYNGELLNSADVMLLFGYTNLNKEEKSIQDRVAKMLNVKEIKGFESMAGRIHISDMEVLTDSKEVKRDGIKIDEDTGTVAKGAKFDYNVLPAGTTFKFSVICENLEDYQLDLLKLAMNDILEGDIFGGKSARGIGKCRLVLDSKVDVVRSSKKDELEKYIFQRKLGSMNTTDLLQIKNLKLK